LIFKHAKLNVSVTAVSAPPGYFAFQPSK